MPSELRPSLSFIQGSMGMVSCFTVIVNQERGGLLPLFLLDPFESVNLEVWAISCHAVD